jgi:hypothetical protein
MNPDIAFLHDIWDSVKPFVTKKERLSAAEAIVRVFDDNIDISLAEDHINEFDTQLKAALVSHLDIGFDEDDEDDNEYAEY